MENQINPFSPECQYWVALNGFCFGTRRLPLSETQIEADAIHRVNPDRQTLAHWTNFVAMNDGTIPQELVIGLQPEEGVTGISLENGFKLLLLHGKPKTLDFKANAKKGDYFLTAKWANGAAWTFNGFAWGYGGTGPTGLRRFCCVMLGNPHLKADHITIDKYGKTDATWTLL